MFDPYYRGQDISDTSEGNFFHSMSMYDLEIMSPITLSVVALLTDNGFKLDTHGYGAGRYKALLARPDGDSFCIASQGWASHGYNNDDKTIYKRGNYERVNLYTNSAITRKVEVLLRGEGFTLLAPGGLDICKVYINYLHFRNKSECFVFSTQEKWGPPLTNAQIEAIRTRVSYFDDWDLGYITVNQNKDNNNLLDICIRNKAGNVTLITV
jgi:hypothetical protein